MAKNERGVAWVAVVTLQSQDRLRRRQAPDSGAGGRAAPQGARRLLHLTVGEDRSEGRGLRVTGQICDSLTKPKGRAPMKSETRSRAADDRGADAGSVGRHGGGVRRRRRRRRAGRRLHRLLVRRRTRPRRDSRSTCTEPVFAGHRAAGRPDPDLRRPDVRARRAHRPGGDVGRLHPAELRHQRRRAPRSPIPIPTSTNRHRRVRASRSRLTNAAGYPIAAIFRPHARRVVDVQVARRQDRGGRGPGCSWPAPRSGHMRSMIGHDGHRQQSRLHLRRDGHLLPPDSP